MKKLSFLMMIVLSLTMGMVFSPSRSYAVLTALTESAMKEATAQAGIAITAADKISHDMQIRNIAYGDTDGTNGKAGYISMNNISLLGVINLKEPVTISVSTEKDPFTNTMLTGINVNFSGARIDIDHFNIGSITVGSAPGEGASFGSISVRDYHALINGNVRITTH